MSEIKGQLLGIILVLSIFATVSVAIGTAFSKMTTTVGNKVDSITSAATNVFGLETLTY